MSVVDQQSNKLGTAAVVIGSIMTVGFLIASIVLWSLPTLTRSEISGRDLGLPFTGTGAVFLCLAGLLIARIGWRVRKSAHGPGPRKPQPPLRRAPRPSHGEWTSS